jgi:hypothetical protein
MPKQNPIRYKSASKSRNFSDRLLAYGQRVVRRGRHLGAYMQAQIASEEEQRQAQHFRKPEVVMTETASMHGLENW